jgi:hypothetical protein
MTEALRSARRGAWLTLGAILLAGCGGATSGGDPGGKRLKELAADKTFSVLPPGATLVSTRRTKAIFRHPAFQGAGWDGPSIVIRFTSTAPPLSIYRFVGARAEAAGWQSTAVGSFGVADVFAKTYRDGATATMSIVRLGIPAASAPGTYLLSGGVATVG